MGEGSGVGQFQSKKKSEEALAAAQSQVELSPVSTLGSTPKEKAFEQIAKLGGLKAFLADQVPQIVEKRPASAPAVLDPQSRADRSHARVDLGSGPRLIVLSSSLRGKVFGVADNIHQGRWLIGSAPDADFCLLDKTVSPYHAQLRHTQGEWIMEAVGSKNSVFVNNREVNFSILAAGDLVRLGHIELKFRTDTQALGSAPKKRSGKPRPQLNLWLIIGALALLGIVIGVIVGTNITA